MHHLLLLDKNQLVHRYVCDKHIEASQIDKKGNRHWDASPSLFTEQKINLGLPHDKQEHHVLHEHNYVTEMEQDDGELLGPSVVLSNTSGLISQEHLYCAQSTSNTIVQSCDHELLSMDQSHPPSILEKVELLPIEVTSETSKKTQSSIEPMANNGLIFVSNTSKVQALCFKACKLVRKMLYIKVNDEAKNTLPILSQQIVNIYSKNAIQCGDIDVRLMLNYKSSMKAILTSSAIDIVMFDNTLTKFAKELKSSVQTATKDAKDVIIDSEDISPMVVSEETVETYDYVALGGTFDRLHNGHKILLSQAALRCDKHMAVGVTDVNMIQSKKLWELIEPVEKRIKSVLDFLNDIKPGLEYDVFPLKDLYGPTKDDPKYQLIVVSEETAKGADKINLKRVENGLPELDRYVICLAEDSTRKSEEEENKVSSSNQRMRLLGTLMRPPQPNPSIPDWPYVIGLAGGIASGKSSIANKLKAKGAAIINCDIIAHELYKPGLPLNSTIAHNFGDHVINNEGEVDRRLLGQIVFGDADKLEKLNQLVWPAVIGEAQRRIQELGKAGYKVVVIEAAVMIKAKWYNQCHQLWTVIIPREEAIKRIKERNNLSEEEARQRVDAQPSNLEQIALANVIFSPYWSYQYTQGQVDRAWDKLQKYLANRK